MTIEEIKTCGKRSLTPNEVAEAIGVAPESIRLQAETDPSKLGFPVTRIGTRTLIWRLPCLRFIGEAE